MKKNEGSQVPCCLGQKWQFFCLELLYMLKTKVGSADIRFSAFGTPLFKFCLPDLSIVKGVLYGLKIRY